MLLLLFELKFVHHFSPKTRCDCSHKHHLCNCVCYTSGRRWSVKIAIVCGACFPFHLLPQMINNRKWLLTKFNNYSAIGKYNITFWSSAFLYNTISDLEDRFMRAVGDGELAASFLFTGSELYTVHIEYVLCHELLDYSSFIYYEERESCLSWWRVLYMKYSMIYYTGRAWDLS